ncbi:hypothetical protein HDV04_004242 [Boothiomyces sp. JEL0838]|nr:hypothetical protein HDV04_004242 [Boothiomyces sp. JEL0838]
MSAIQDNLSLIKQNVQDLAAKYNREITLVAMSKTKPIQDIMECYQTGHLHYGENILAKIPNLYVVETIDSEKQASMLSKHLDRKMNIFLQVNTSNEENKSGIKPENLDGLVEAVLQLPNLELKGLMTIGSFDNSHSEGLNPDFQVLMNCKSRIEQKYNIKLKVSMGMSDDYEQAIHQGSTNVRVGSKIFGPRIYKK